LKPGDLLYLFTDGYTDQFGGVKGKKLKQKGLTDFLLAKSDHGLAEQSALLERNFEDWKGQLEQVDDVLVIGIRF
ncbi:MAG: SpoIIE family protein phosphatase, partial [Bacteroidia bacterium]